MTQTIVNLGTGGALLNGRNGSTAGADSNDALFLDWPGDNAGSYVYLPGVASNFLSVPDEAALDITGDIDIRVQVALDDWTPAATNSLVSKFQAGGQNSWRLEQGPSSLAFIWSADGTNNAGVVSATVPTGVADGVTKWIRVTVDVDNGAGGHDVKFFLSDDNVTYTQLGATVTAAGATSFYVSTSPIEVGSAIGGADQNASGFFYRAQLFNGINGTKVLDVDTSVISSGSATSFTALTGQTVTINRGTAGRKSVAVVNPCWLFGTDDYMEVADNALLDFGASDSFTVLAVVRQWTDTIDFTGIVRKYSGGAGWGLLVSQTDLATYAFISDGTVTNDTNSQKNQATNGQLMPQGFIRNTVTDKVVNFAGVTVASGITDTTTGSLANTSVLEIGYSGAYADMELIALAIFRRALTATEISQITAYYQARLS